MDKNGTQEKSYQTIFNYFTKVFSIDPIEYSSKRKKLHLPRIPYKLLIDILNDSMSIFKSEPNILRINSPLAVIGDIHGHILDLFRILKTIGCPSLKADNDNLNNSKNSNDTYFTDADYEHFNANRKSSKNLHNYSSHSDIHNTNYSILGSEFIDDSPIANIDTQNPDNSPKNNEFSTKYLFLGDFVDRGQFSFETILLILIMKILFPTEIFIVRGNHEFKETYTQGLQSFGIELRDIYPNQSDEVSEAFENCFSYIPLAAIIDNDTICLHGGIGTSLKDGNLILLESEICRPIHDFNNPIVSDILWSDPSEYILNFQPSSRGSGSLFGIASLNRFLDACSLKRMIRGHQCIEEGVFSLWDDKCFTVFSASNYCGALNNKSGILKINKKEGENQSQFEYKPIILDPIPVLSRSAAIFDELSKCESFISNFGSIISLPSISNGSLLVAKPRTPKPGSQRGKFKNRSKSQLISKRTPEIRTTGSGTSILCRKQLEKDKILMPQPLAIHHHPKKSHESLSLQPLKKGPLM